MARILGTHLGEALKGTIVIENRPGGGGNIGIGIAAHAEPDGHTLLITSSAYVVNPGLYAKSPTTLSKTLQQLPSSAPHPMWSWSMQSWGSIRSPT